MNKNLTKALEMLAKYGFAVNAEQTADNERTEIYLLSAAKIHLSISTDIPNSEKLDIADNLYSAAEEYENHFQSLADACYDLRNGCNAIYAEAYEEECRKRQTADHMEDMEGELD